MKKVDYLIVGYGIAGACFAKKCIENGNSFKIISDFEISASHIAAGMFNPVILHRFNPVHQAVEQMNVLKKTFSEFEKLLDKQLIHSLPVYRIFGFSDEPLTWKNKIAENPVLQQFLSPEIKNYEFSQIHAPYGFGEVLHSGRIDMKALLEAFYSQYKSYFIQENFNFNALDITTKTYNKVQFNKIVFAEGIEVNKNPFFGYIPVIPNKGEILIIATDADLPEIIFKSKNFLMPLGNGKFYVGATYDRSWQTDEPTPENRNKLINNLKVYFKGNFEIMEHHAAFRPTTPDRRGIIGEHPKFKDFYVLNGMGTRGTFHAPYLSEVLFNTIEKNHQIPEDINVKRFNQRLNA